MANGAAKDSGKVWGSGTVGNGEDDMAVEVVKKKEEEVVEPVEKKPRLGDGKEGKGAAWSGAAESQAAESATVCGAEEETGKKTAELGAAQPMGLVEAAGTNTVGGTSAPSPAGAGAAKEAGQSAGQDEAEQDEMERKRARHREKLAILKKIAMRTLPKKNL